MKKSTPLEERIDLNDDLENLQKQVQLYENEKNILLELSKDITRVRDKNDLIDLFSQRIQGMFYFTHTSITLIDQKREYYFPFLLDHRTSVVREHPAYGELATSHFTLNDPLIQNVVNADGPVTYLLEDVVNDPGVPPFLIINHERGIAEVMFTALRSRDQVIGFINIYSDKTGSFTDDFKNTIKGIAPHLSNAVSNIIINEQVAKKEKVNKVLLELSNELVTVRSRTDLLNVINHGLGKLIGFSHNVMTILDESSQTYNAYLTESDPKPENFSKYTEAISRPNPVKDGFYDVASQSSEPVIFSLKNFDLSSVPYWVRLNYAAGAREMMIKVLPLGDGPQYSIILFSDKSGFFDDEAIQIVERISSQLSTAANNIAANEELLKKEGEKSFLLSFSQNIAAVRTKQDLATAIFSVLQQVLKIRLPMIRVIDQDGVTLYPYMFDKDMFGNNEENFKQLASKNITTSEYLSAKVLNSKDPVIFNIEQEERNGNSAQYISFWKKFGLKNAYGAALRVGDRNLGTLWLLTDEVNQFILKGICAQISIAISNIMANDKVLEYKQRLEVENDHLKEQIRTIFNYSDIIGSGPEMQKVYHLMSLVAETNSTVLLLGETGTGKELIARAIHNTSPRKNKLMIKVNCAALPANLIESELFGHEKGAFTGAIDRRIGKFELANGSTLFLDEIGEMPLESQVKLLRVLQEKELERVGGKSTIKVDVRIIAATNRDLEAEVAAGRFRSDLFYRLNVFPINLPPLRERHEDIAPLANFFVGRYSKNAGRKVSGISPKVVQELKSYLWPGNVRELEHLIERSVLLTTDSTLREIYLPKGRSESKNEPIELTKRTLEEVERAYIIEVIKRCSGKVAGAGGAAEYLDVPATTLHSKIKKLKISKGEYF